mgnify:CR=1 FL=1
MTLMTLETQSGETTTVKVVRETAKALQVRGNCSKAWFPKKALNSDGVVADWFNFTMLHTFLWEAPYDERKHHPTATI